eukprot:TsM_000798300 transcript=TsM_000798300 gene=TsM_000798300
MSLFPRQIAQCPKGSRTLNSVESFDSVASRESPSTSDDSQQPSIGLCYTNDKPPLIANRITVRSHSAHSRPLKCQMDQSNGRGQKATNIYFNGADAGVAMAIIRQPPNLSGADNDPQRVIHKPVAKQQLIMRSGCNGNAYENNFQVISRVCQPDPISTHYFQAYYPQFHFNSTYSDGQMYDQPPPPHSEEMEARHKFRSSGNNNQHYNEGLTPRMIPPVPPSTAPTSRRQFGRSNYENEAISGDEKDEEEENGSERGGTLSRKQPSLPMGVLLDGQ